MAPSRARHRRARRGIAAPVAAVLVAAVAVVGLVVGPVAANAWTGATRTSSASTTSGSTTYGTAAVTRATGTTASGAADCSAGRVLTVVAHADDDLLFDGTALRTDVDAGRCVRSVVVTGGDAGKPAWYWQGREDGLMAAYANLAGVAPQWASGTLTAGGKTLRTATLTTNPRLSLVFLELPDGNVDGSGFAADGSESLQKLYQGGITTMHTLTGAAQPTTYTLPQLKATLLGVMQDFAPTDVHTLDHVGGYGDGDHSDHHTIGYLTDQVQKQYTGTHAFTGYMGYPIANRPSNLTQAQTDAKGAVFYTYAAHDGETCASWQACSSKPEGSWLSRQYTAGSSVPTTPGNPTNPGGTTPTEPTSPTRGTDVTGTATVTASGENAADGQTAKKAVDGVFSGYPDAPTAEWAVPWGGVGTWIQLGWSGATTIGEVDLADRPNADDQVTGGTLTFSDGSSLTVPTLDNGGAVTRLAFTARKVTWARFTVTAVSGSTRNVGLSEIRVYGPATSSTPSPTPTPTATSTPTSTPTATPTSTPTATPTGTPTATPTPTPTPTSADITGSATPTAAWDNPADGQTVAKGVDGIVSGYPKNSAAEWVAPWGRTGVWFQLDWSSSVSLQRIVLNDRPNLSDRITSGTLTFSDGSQVQVGSLPDDGSALTVDFSARNVKWVRFTTTGVSNSTTNVGLSEIRAWGVR
ncbi:PIG-L family deacetylase [Curtobacterium sp. VKM Ac-1395]|uniref:DUF7402 domain-containing protein n=1 Tax=Curtobacterium sp. VKM Ac-1395 TaxID=2783815 RepID=UPI00188BD63B|nr:PIG-L family deacetylase [Curtobacterium sp. VKM Ac-1395]MBF4589391.1 PIG-L family deacetylase [Curtobacterium sp. VKM Ac-1395]